MLRKELQPPKINNELVKELMQLIDEISELFDEYYEEYYIKKEKTILNEKIDCLNSKVEKEYEPMDFANYLASTSLEEISKMVALPNPPIIKDITIEETTEIIEIIANLEWPQEIDEVEEVDIYIEYYLELMGKSIPNKDISDLIYWYDVEEYGHEPTAREIAEKAFKMREVNVL
ncbi:hypothetical protein [Clostridium lundense]|uniref:hypothetical protein n=1 Tax=Clostridium lundense TaxID=319475 RepID=UPI000487FBC4|nr:hypothetical protein [Clostridium lundense]